MQSIWRRTNYLFWQFPVLWLPVLSADCCAFWVKQFRTIAIYQLRLLFTPHESVFSNRPAPLYPGSADSITYLWFTAPVIWITNLAFLYFYVLAFKLTAELISKRLGNSRSTLQDMLRHCFRQPSRDLLFLAKLVVLLLGALLLETNQNFFKIQRSYLGSPNLILAVAIFAMTCIGALMGPGALRLIRLPKLDAPTAADKSAARIFAALAILASTIIGYAASTVEQSIYSDLYPHVPKAVLEMFGSLLAAVPYIPLFIALSLLATPAPETPASSTLEPASDTPSQPYLGD